MVNHPNRNRFTRWLNQRDGLSDDPFRRAAQIALSAIDEIDFSELTDDTGMIVAYEALVAVLSKGDDE